MGQITRTQFGCTKTRRLTNAEIIAASVDPGFVFIEGIPGRMIMPLCAFIRFDWAADYGSIDGGAGVGFTATDLLVGPFVLSLYQNHGGAVNVLAPGESIVVPFGVESAGSTGWTSNADPVLPVATYDGLPLYFSINNNGAGPIDGGDALNSMDIEVHYIVI